MKIVILLCILGTAFAIPTGQVAPSESNSPSGIVESAAPAEPEAKAEPAVKNTAASAAPPPLTQAQANELARQNIINLHNAEHARIVALQKTDPKYLERLAKIPAYSLSGGKFEASPVNLIIGVDEKGCIVGESGKICPTGSVQFVV